MPLLKEAIWSQKLTTQSHEDNSNMRKPITSQRLLLPLTCKFKQTKSIHTIFYNEVIKAVKNNRQALFSQIDKQKLSVSFDGSKNSKQKNSRCE